MFGWLRSFVFAWRGIILAFNTQRNFRVHTGISLITLFGSIYFKISHTEWLMVLLSMGLVYGLECINSSIEELTNIVCPHFDERAGKVKDLAAGAVLIASVFVFIIAILIFIPKIWELISGPSHVR